MFHCLYHDDLYYYNQLVISVLRYFKCYNMQVVLKTLYIMK